MEKTSNAHGGARKGAGRKKDPVRRAILEAAEQARAEALTKLNAGETPLDYMLRIMRDGTVEDKRRDGMAIAAASFIHPKLAAVEHSGNADKPIAYNILSGVDRTDAEVIDTLNGHDRADH